jgi:hypothetical protein
MYSILTAFSVLVKFGIAGEPDRIRLRIRLSQHPGQALSSTNKHTRKDHLNFTDTLINN